VVIHEAPDHAGHFIQEQTMVDYRNRVTLPIRDLGDEQARVICLVDVYGVTTSDIACIGGDVGSRPFHKAVERLGLDPLRYQATIWDLFS
jgi:hypothetical protein